MGCKNCPPVNRELRIKISNWLAGGYDYNKVAALLNCSYDLVVDVSQNGVGEEEIITYVDTVEEEIITYVDTVNELRTKLPELNKIEEKE
jgi:hypothetical protein